ncbi:Acetokinase family-domain-containing protein [Bisporella sp. PMI_857]|nr:Acetokinase family-domain-containing protein [Bisporella sp. PMI_857]
MSKTILSINAGSSSVKLSLYRTSKDDPTPKALADIQISGLTSPPPLLTYKRREQSVHKNKKLKEDNIKNQKDAFSYMLDELVNDAELKEVSKQEDISVTCHRVVHGGDFDHPKILNEDTYHRIEALTDLAPLHNASALEIIKFCIAALPSALNIAVFDSQFHQTIPEHIRTYPISPSIARSNKLRKYGFHGISYSFITRSVAAYLRKPAEQTSLILLHLGSGASACAVKEGKSLNTSMGLTPLSGLPGATRSGNVDPSLVFHYAANVGKLSPASTGDLHISRAEEILNKEAGWKALTGTTDFGAIAAAVENGGHGEEVERKRLAFNIFVERVCGFVGNYYVGLGGKVDALVFAGGIGEKSALLRQRVADQVQCLGFGVDLESNKKEEKGVVWDIGIKGARHRTLVCETDEQFEMARICVEEKEFVE